MQNMKLRSWLSCIQTISRGSCCALPGKGQQSGGTFMKKSGCPLRAILTLAVCVWFTGSVYVQNAAAQGTPVHVLVTAEAHHGSTVPEITKSDVFVYEGKDRDQVTDWVPAQGEHAGLELFILLDDGSSSSLGTQLEDLRKFI